MKRSTASTLISLLFWHQQLVSAERAVAMVTSNGGVPQQFDNVQNPSAGEQDDLFLR